MKPAKILAKLPRGLATIWRARNCLSLRLLYKKHQVDEMESKLFYPEDSGGPLEDRAILRNAAEFSSLQRSWRALETLKEPTYGHLDNRQRAMLAFEGFQAMMVSLEDLQAWLFILRDWKPGTSEGSLFALLDRVQVGRKIGGADWSEDAALEFLESLTPATYRDWFGRPRRRNSWPLDGP